MAAYQDAGNAYQSGANAYQDGATPTGRSKYYSIDGIPIPFTDDAYDASAALIEKRRQIMHEDQIMIDVIVQAVTSGMLK